MLGLGFVACLAIFRMIDNHGKFKIEKGFRDGLSYSNPQKATEEMPLPSLSFIPLRNVVQ